MDLMNFLFPILLVGMAGVIGVTSWLAWIIFKMRYKDQLEAPQQPVRPPRPAREPEDVPFLKLTRTPFGEWEIFVEGQHYRTIQAVPDDVVRQDIVSALKALVAFARTYVQKTQGAPQPASSSVPEPITLDRPVERHQPPGPSGAPVETGQSAPPSPGKKARVYLSGEPALKRPDTAPTLMPSIDLAREIGDIVNEMQTRIPSLAGRSIRLQNAPSGGIQFAIDGIVYSEVEAIPDLDVQALIRAATQEWERR